MNPQAILEIIIFSISSATILSYFRVPAIKLWGVCDSLDASQMWHPKELLTKKKRRKRFLVHNFGCRIHFFRKSLKDLWLNWLMRFNDKMLFMCCFSLCQHDSSHLCMLTCCQVFPALPAPTPAPAPGAFTGVSTAGCWMTCHDLLRNGQPRNWAGRGWNSAAGGDACFGAGFIRWGFQWLEWMLQKIKVDSS